MSFQYPAAGRVTGSDTDGPSEVLIAGDPPPLPREPATDAAHQSQPEIDSAPYGMSTARSAGSLDPRTSRGEQLQEELDGLADDVLEKATIELHRSINAAQAQFVLQIREMERRGVPEVSHGLRITGWLKKFCQMTPAEASGTVKTARAMAHMPNVADRALSGAVPGRSTQLLGQARDRHPAEFVHHEPVFADVATYLSAADLRKAINHWEQQVDYPQALHDVERRNDRRSLYLAELLDGMGDIRGTLTPELFELVSTAIASRVSPTFLDADDTRTPAQRRADALGDVCRFYLDHNKESITSGGEKPHITVTIDWSTLEGKTTQLPDVAGMPVGPETVRRIACDAGIIPMVLGSDSEPLDVGRKTRTIPSAIRRALEHRDQGCTWEGCGAPISWCDAHHRTHWADGGHTSLDNLTLLCRTHHTTTHNGRTPPPEP